MKIVKSYLSIFTGVVAAICLHACKKDNYIPPSVKFTGRIVYQGTPIGVKNNNNNNSNNIFGTPVVYFELWQPGFGKSGAIDVVVDQDGSFSSLLYKGTYKLVVPSSQGPWMSVKNEQTNSDTIPLVLNGDQTMDIEVMPYYMFGNTSFQLGADSVVTASCAINRIIKDANQKSIDFVALYVNRTSFVDDDNKIVSASVSGAAITDLANLKFTVKIPANIGNGSIGVADQNYFYARIGLKISGVDDMLFSDIQKITLP